MSFQNNIKRISKRNWQEILIKWLDNIPIFDPGLAPLSQISDLYHVQKEFDNTPNNGEYKVEIEGLRSSIFHEGIFLIHKSINTFLSAEQNYSNGFSSWSLSSSYHSAFYAVKAFLCFSGITLPKYKGSYYLIDVFTEPEKLSSNQMKRGEKPENTMMFIKMNNLLHYNIWKIFQRLLNVSEYKFLDETIKNTLINFDELEFAKQRNEIHYINNHWPLNDLFNKIRIDNFGFEELFIENLKTFHPELRTDFSIVLALLLLRLNVLLLKDLSLMTNLIKNEMQLIDFNLEKSESYLNFNF